MQTSDGSDHVVGRTLAKLGEEFRERPEERLRVIYYSDDPGGTAFQCCQFHPILSSGLRDSCSRRHPPTPPLAAAAIGENGCHGAVRASTASFSLPGVIGKPQKRASRVHT